MQWCLGFFGLFRNRPKLDVQMISVKIQTANVFRHLWLRLGSEPEYF